MEPDQGRMLAVEAQQPDDGSGPVRGGNHREPAGGAGLGLVRGLATTARALLRPATTQEYPDVEPDLPPRSRGVIGLVEENCTVCMLCARECPDWCIYIDSHKETLPAVEGGRERQRNVLDRFAIDFSLCMYCGICVEVCPFDALHWSPEFEYSELDIRDLLHEKDRLGQWMPTVPVPPALDPGAAEPAEIAAAAKPARPARTPRAAATARPATAPPPAAPAPAAVPEPAAGSTGAPAGPTGSVPPPAGDTGTAPPAGAAVPDTEAPPPPPAGTVPPAAAPPVPPEPDEPGPDA